MSTAAELLLAAPYDGEPLGPKDAVSVEIQRFGPDGLLLAREKIAARVVGGSTVTETEPDLSHLDALVANDQQLTHGTDPVEYPIDGDPDGFGGSDAGGRARG